MSILTELVLSVVGGFLAAAHPGSVHARGEGGDAQALHEWAASHAESPPASSSAAHQIRGTEPDRGAGLVALSASSELRRSAMNCSNSALSLAIRSLSRNNWNWPASCSRRRSVSSRYSSNARFPLGSKVFAVMPHRFILSSHLPAIRCCPSSRRPLPPHPILPLHIKYPRIARPTGQKITNPSTMTAIQAGRPQSSSFATTSDISQTSLRRSDAMLMFITFT
jgi:hypothetical protein